MFEELLISGDQLPTSNSKIFKSIEAFPTKETMQDLVSKIKSSIEQDDFESIIHIFKENVEGYRNESK